MRMGRAPLKLFRFDPTLTCRRSPGSVNDHGAASALAAAEAGSGPGAVPKARRDQAGTAI
jgi:hypothetical protein